MNRFLWASCSILLVLQLGACAGETALRFPFAATITPLPTEPPTVTPLPTEPPTITPLPTEPPTITPLPTEPPTITPLPAGPRYVYPVDAAVCQASSSHHDYPASDIFCPIGTAYVAVTDGIVDYISRIDRYALGERDPALRGGLSVAFIGNDGVRYYGSHLSAVADDLEVGMRVSAGQLLGLTGDSGNAAGTPPHVHFGISPPTTPDDWAVRRGTIWPQPYLRAWANGEALTPVLEP